MSVMKTTKKLFYTFITLGCIFLSTNCGGPSTDKNAKELIDAQAKLERDLAMYEDTWSRFLKGDTAIVNNKRFHEDVVVVTAQGDLVGIEACKNIGTLKERIQENSSAFLLLVIN